MSALGVVGVLGNLLGGGIEAYGQQVQSHRGRQFAREMASTQYQRAVQDMRAAGLNPMAIFGSGSGSPAAAPAGEFANPFEGASKLGDEIGSIFTRGEVADTLKAQADVARANARAAESDADLKLAENSAYRAALDTEVGRAGAVSQRYGTLGGAGEVIGTLGVGNVLGGDATAKAVSERTKNEPVLKGPPSRSRLQELIESSRREKEDRHSKSDWTPGRRSPDR